MNAKYAAQTQTVRVAPPKKSRLTLECDELWSYVGTKKHKVWVWAAQDRDTRESVGVHLADRSRVGAQALWDGLPPVYRQCAVCYTDAWDAFTLACLPPAIASSLKPNAAPIISNPSTTLYTNLRQRSSRFVRKALSFSNKLANHLGVF